MRPETAKWLSIIERSGYWKRYLETIQSLEKLTAKEDTNG